jgi:hypothetical protein
MNARKADYRTSSVSDEKAKKLTDEYVSVQQAETFAGGIVVEAR